MGLYDRDYERSYDTGSGWRDPGARGSGFAEWSANSKLLVLIAGVYVAQLVFEGFTELFALPSNWFSEPWRVYGLVSYSLLHSTQQLNHLLFNCLAIFFFGRTINQRLGGREYLLFFFASSVFAGVVWTIATQMAGDAGLLLGASGGISAIVVLFALWYPNVQVYLMGILPVPAGLMAVLFVGMDIWGAFNRAGNVAYTAHLGGALFGYLYYRYGWRLSNLTPDSLNSVGEMFQSKPKLRVHRGAEEDEHEAVDPADDRVDEILRKIQSKGQQSLTREEQRILERASRRYQQRRR